MESQRRHALTFCSCLLVCLLVVACDDNPVDAPQALEQSAEWTVVSRSPGLVALVEFGPEHGAVLAESGSRYVLSEGQWQFESGDRRLALHAAWGVSPDDIYASGYPGKLYHYNGSSWEDMVSPTDSDIFGIWGASPDSIFAVGDYGSILRFDGATWSQMPSGVGYILRTVHGLDSGHVYAAGREGTFLEYDGVTWTRSTVTGRPDCADLFALAPDDIYVAGFNGAVRHFDGVDWVNLGTGDGENWGAIGAVSPTEVYLSGDRGSVLRHDGTSWIRLRDAADDYNLRRRGLGIARPLGDAVVFAGGYGEIVEQRGGVLETVVEGGVESTTFRAGWKDAGGALFLIGDAGVWMYEQGSWTDHPLWPWLFSLWGTAANNVYVVGRGGYLARFDGSSWVEQASNTNADLRSVWGVAPDDILAVGSEAVYFDGSVWEPVPDPPAGLRDVWGGIYSLFTCVGDNGTIAVYNGIQWVTQTSGVDTDLKAVSGVPGGVRIAVGAGGVALMNENGLWSPMETGTSESLTDVWVVEPDEAYAAGAAGTVLHWDGAAWSVSETFGSEFLSFIAGDDTVVYCGGRSVLARLDR